MKISLSKSLVLFFINLTQVTDGNSIFVNCFGPCIEELKENHPAPRFSSDLSKCSSYNAVNCNRNRKHSNTLAKRKPSHCARERETNPPIIVTPVHLEDGRFPAGECTSIKDKSNLPILLYILFRPDGGVLIFGARTCTFIRRGLCFKMSLLGFCW